MSEICIGYVKSHKQRCENRISAERSGKRTCGVHKSQESILETYKGATDDLETLSRFHERIFGERHTYEPESLEYLKPERFSQKKNAKWRAFGGGAKESDFNGDFEPKNEDAFQKAAWDVLAKNIEKAGFFVLSTSAFVAAFALTLYYYVLGFGILPVAVERNSLSSLAVAALVFGAAFYLTLLAKHKINDTRYLSACRQRHEKVVEHRNNLKQVKKDADRYNTAIDQLLHAQDLNETANQVKARIDALRPPSLPTPYSRSNSSGLLARLKSSLKWALHTLKSAAEANPDAYDRTAGLSYKSSADPDVVDADLSRFPASKLAADNQYSYGDVIGHLNRRLEIYKNALKAKGELLGFAKVEHQVISENDNVKKFDDDLKELRSSNSWFAGAIGFKPLFINFLFVSFVAYRLATHSNGAASIKDYCENPYPVGPRCVHMVVKGLPGEAKKIHRYDHVLYHGRVGDQVIFTELFPTKENQTSDAQNSVTASASPGAGEIDANLHTLPGKPDALPFLNQAAIAAGTDTPDAPVQSETNTPDITAEKHRLPASAVLSIQTFKPDRLEPSDTPAIAPSVINLTLENRFTTINTGSGTPGGGDTFITRLEPTNTFVSNHKNITKLSPTNHFTTDIVRKHASQNVILSHFIQDGQLLETPDANMQHILVPFFLKRVPDRKGLSARGEKLFDVNNNNRIDVEIEAFVEGYQSLSLPDYPPETQIGVDGEKPKNLLHAVRVILEQCTGPKGQNNPNVEIHVTGYASATPFKYEDEPLPNSNDLNHALAEGRRVAVLMRLMDFWRHEATDRVVQASAIKENEKAARIILSSQERKKISEHWDDSIWTFLTYLNEGKLSDLDAFFKVHSHENFYERLREGFRFVDHPEMQTSLLEWTNAGDGGGAIKEAFQRSAVISISEEQLKKCGVN